MKKLLQFFKERKMLTTILLFAIFTNSGYAVSLSWPEPEYQPTETECPMPTIYEPDWPESLTVSQAINYTPPNVTYSNGLTGACAISGIIQPTDFFNYWNECSGGYLTFTYAEYLTWLNDVYFHVVRIEVIPDGSCETDEFCTLTQGAYGNPGGTYCNGQSQRQLMDQLLSDNGGMVLGLPGNNRSFTIPAQGGQCIEDILPGGGPSTVLTGNFGCGNFGTLLKNGRLHNSLLAQTITLQLNLWLSPGLDNLILESPNFITVGSSGCGGGINGGNSPMEDTMYFSIPSSVYNYLPNKTVGDIFILANKALGTSPWPSGKPSLSAIAEAVNVINKAFDECRFIYFPDYLRTAPVIAGAVANNIELTIAPNPFNLTTQITFSTNQNTRVNAEIYDLQGRLITKLFEGNMQANETKTLNYTIPANETQTPRLCIIRTANSTKHQVLLNMR